MNSKESGTLSRRQISDLKVIFQFVHLYCGSKHKEREKSNPEYLQGLMNTDSGKRALCSECADLFLYGVQKRRKCPLDPKPTCKNCHVHCYSGEYRAKIRKIMAYSGRRMIMRGRLDYLWHYYF